MPVQRGLYQMVNDAEEAEANYFAMCLLMPEKFVRAEVAKMGNEIDLCNDRAILRLAKTFGVSVAMMTLRLTQIYKLQ